MNHWRILTLAATAFLTGCGGHAVKPTTVVEPSASIDLDVPYESFTLDNGLQVILHQDHSDPIVAIATIVHVGSAREKTGRTGFAHFFEHMSFNNSENVPMGANRKMIPELGGTRNGGTWSDGTMYYEVVPKDAFEKLMWIDSDRFGYMINTVNEATLEREKQVVKNEKRQRVDNRAYGHTSHVIKKALYPESHPYNWTVIGDLEDLQNATLADVVEFYEKFYTPANATLVIAGDIDVEETKASVVRWFGEIKAGDAVDDLAPMHVSLDQSKSFYHEDNFAKLPEIRLTYPTVEQYHPDSYALAALGEVLSSGQQAPMFTTIVKEQKLSAGVAAYNSSDELTGTFTFRVRANAGVDLDDVAHAIDESLSKFEEEGVRDNALTKIKARQETAFYNGISSVLNKAFQLGIYNEFAGDPEFYKQDIANIKAVTKDDVMRVYHQYIKDQPAIITSFVPKGEVELAVEDALKADVVEEQIVQGKEKEFSEDMDAEYVITPTKHDRSEPPLGELPVMKSPEIWRATLDNGMHLAGIEHDELPLVNFTLRIPGGQSLDPEGKDGTASLLASMLSEGTANKTPAELEDAIGLLGSGISVSASKTAITVSGNTLRRNLQATLDLVREMLTEPRFDESDFERIKTRTLEGIRASYGNPSAVAQRVFMKQLYGDDHVAGRPTSGTIASVEGITLDDVKAWYKSNITARDAQFNFAGMLTAKDAQSIADSMSAAMQDHVVTLPEQPATRNPDHPKVYFIDIPNAKQSVLYVGKNIPSGHHEDNHKIEIVNNRLGSGSSARLTQMLRITKGYTYGAYSYISAGDYDGAFIASTQVRSNVTLESLEILKDLIGNYAATFEAEDLVTTQNLLKKGNTRRFETLNQLLGAVNDVTRFNKGGQFLEEEQQELADMTLDQAHALINRYLDEQQMIYVIAGDAKTQLSRIKDLGYGEPMVLDKEGMPASP